MLPVRKPDGSRCSFSCVVREKLGEQAVRVAVAVVQTHYEGAVVAECSVQGLSGAQISIECLWQQRVNIVMQPVPTPTWVSGPAHSYLGCMVLYGVWATCVPLNQSVRGGENTPA